MCPIYPCLCSSPSITPIIYTEEQT
jgi:hypothetical protein